MADEADIGNETAARMLEAARVARERAAAAVRPAMKEVGQCYSCLDPIPAGLYCDDDCKADHARAKAARQRAGLPG
jgi:hypothetical protein